MNDAFFSTDRLTVGYHGVPLIRDISLRIRRGEILTLIGPNGSGKSTVLKSLTRHLSPLGGVVYLENRDMRQMSAKEVATRLSVMLTDRVRPELMTCGELVATGRYPYTNGFGRLTEKDEAIVQASLERVHAADLFHRDFLAISDGQRQRVLLARAICQEPEVLVLDEPTSYLDIRHKLELLEILREMAQEQHIAIVMSLHEIDLAAKISHRILCVKGETIEKSGTPEEIFSGDTIEKLYDLESGSYDLRLGSVEFSRPAGAPRCLVIGGNGSGIPYYRSLQKQGVPFAAGILFENDVDCAVAIPLAANVLLAPAFSPIPASLLESAAALLPTVECVVDCGQPIGPYNRSNGLLLEAAQQAKIPVLHTQAELQHFFGGIQP